jgi:hypothetical protein
MAEGNIPLLSDLVTAVITYGPRFVFAIITLVLGWMIGRLVGFILNIVLGKMGWESPFRRTSVGRAILRSGFTPSSFFAAIGKGFIYMFTIIFALTLLSIPLITTTVQGFLAYLPNLIEGVLILIVGFVFADWIGESVEKGSLSNVPPALFGGLFRILLCFVTITIALAQMKIDITILYIFAEAFAWSLAIAVGIAFGWYLKDRVRPWLDKIVAGESSKTDNMTGDLREDST